VSGLVVLAIVTDPASRALLPRLLGKERLFVATDLTEGLQLAQTEAPDVAFVDITIGDGAGLALVHHINAVAPGASIFALCTVESLEAGANVVALGGTGLLMLPLGGDEILSAVSSVKTRRAEAARLRRLETHEVQRTQMMILVAKVAELADAADRTTAARQLVQVMIEASGADGAAVYAASGDEGRTTELTRVTVTPELDDAPAFGAEIEILDYARRDRLTVVPLALRKLAAGYVLLLRPHAESEALANLLGAQAATAFALLGERDRVSGGGSIKDPSSSAYSFAYYVDVAGREIDKARRFNRRFAVATIALEPTLTQSAAEVADHLLKAVRDTDILARVDDREFHLLLPETDAFGAHLCRRRILQRMAGGERRSCYVPRGLLLGVATFPHDGPDLSQLLRVARRRADATKDSVVHRLAPDQGGLGDVLETLEWDLTQTELQEPSLSSARRFELPSLDAAALAAAVVTDSLRGGATFIAVANHADVSLSAAVRASIGTSRDNVTLHALDLGFSSEGADIEALAVIAEHGSYALLGRTGGGMLRGIHAADPLLADVLADRLGRAVGVRVFN
jgi:ActR/RegA family two-component response regulator/GGDEF domain-containing protein